MEEQTPTEKPDILPEPSKPQSKYAVIWVVLLLLVLTAAGSYEVYAWQGKKISASINTTNTLTADVAKLNSQIATTATLNNGTTPANIQRPASGTADLLSGKVTLALPSGWVRATATNLNDECPSGSIVSKALCEDVATVVPASFNNNSSSTSDPSQSFRVIVGVYQRTDSKDAADWLNTDYGAEFTSDGDPQAINLAEFQVSGSDAYTFTTQYTDKTPPTTITYGIVHGNYAVVVESTYVLAINDPNNSGSSTAKDYSQYLPDTKSIVNSIKFSN